MFLKQLWVPPRFAHQAPYDHGAPRSGSECGMRTLSGCSGGEDGFTSTRLLVTSKSSAVQMEFKPVADFSSQISKFLRALHGRWKFTFKRAPDNSFALMPSTRWSRTPVVYWAARLCKAALRAVCFSGLFLVQSLREENRHLTAHAWMRQACTWCISLSAGSASMHSFDARVYGNLGLSSIEMPLP